MRDHTTRRGFLRTAAAASGALALHGLRGATHAGQPAESEAGQPAGQPAGGPSQKATVRPSASSGPPGSGPILVVAPSLSRDYRARATSWGYIAEILERAGLFFELVDPADLASLPGGPSGVVLLAGDLPLTSQQRDALAASVKQGGSLIGIGGTSGLDEVFGATQVRPLMEGWIKVTDAEHPITSGMRSSLHVFGGHALKPSSATSLATLEAGSQGPRGRAIVENTFGKGRTVLVGPDLIFSIMHIQQGVPVLQDAKSSPDDSAPYNDGELKAEDGFVLDWNRDRVVMQPEDVPAFIEPITDELREIILKSIFHVAAEQGMALPVLWYWPRGIPAVGHISHDTDGNVPSKAVSLLEVMNRSKVKSTWCTLFPGGYPKDFYTKLKDQDYEIALHYDARTGTADRLWSKENFLMQHAWLLKEAGLDTILSNKNHYTRWEGRLDFYRWCEEVGLKSDQTRGPSKPGATGYPLGGSQPYFPWDDEADAPRLLDVLEVNMLTQDLVVVCPEPWGKPLLDSARKHNGVAHFLFHPAHIEKPTVADSLLNLIEYGTAQGLEWWTNGQVYQWESARRGVKAKFRTRSAFSLHAAGALPEATLLFLKSPKAGKPRSIRVNGQATPSKPWTMHGFEFDAVALDVAGEVAIEIG